MKPSTRVNERVNARTLDHIALEAARSQRHAAQQQYNKPGSRNPKKLRNK